MIQRFAPILTLITLLMAAVQVHATPLVSVRQVLSEPSILQTIKPQAGANQADIILAKGKGKPRLKPIFQREAKPRAKAAKPEAPLRKPIGVSGAARGSSLARRVEAVRLTDPASVAKPAAHMLTLKVRKSVIPLSRAKVRLRLDAIRSERNAFNFRDVGPYLSPAKKPRGDEKKPLSKAAGRQSSKFGRFEGVKLSSGHGENGRYLWTIDRRGINIALEATPIGANKNIRHTNLSRKASIGGEVWFVAKREIVINAGSGRFGDGNTHASNATYQKAIDGWRSLGYNVTVVPFNAR